MSNDIAIEAEVPLLVADWFDPLEAGIRQRIRSFIENMLEEELAATWGEAGMTAVLRRPAIAMATGSASCSARSGR